MGWEGHHLYQFGLRAVRYGSSELCASSPDVTLATLQLRKGARFSYEYDLNIPWAHEVRVEDRIQPRSTRSAPAAPVIVPWRIAAAPKASWPTVTMRRRGKRWRNSANWPMYSAKSRRSGGPNSSMSRPSSDWSAPLSEAKHASAPRGGRSPGDRSTPVCGSASTRLSCSSSGDPLRSELLRSALARSPAASSAASSPCRWRMPATCGRPGR